MVLAGEHSNESERTRFLNEAETIARLKHSNIVQIHEIGEHDGRPFFALELVPDGDLLEFLNGEPQPARDSAAMVETLARAIHYAHEHGVIHRDLKPANILLDNQDSASTKSQHDTSKQSRESQDSQRSSSQIRFVGPTPKITDFGLAKQLDTDSELTRTGSVLGTPLYMSPEQAAGRVREIGPASDIYSLGAILYLMLTARPPFQGEGVAQTLLMVQNNEPVPPTKLSPRLPRDLETICLKCLAKEPAKRYAAADDLAADLRRFLHNEPIIARPVGSVERVIKWAKRRPAIAGLLALLVVVLTLGVSGIGWQWREAVSARNQAVKKAAAEREASKRESQAKSAAQESEQNAL
ncbi:MAG: serine/threonine protein kinase, partial [Planctomycetes bacterium]|nr:serine/threonine protein kinase [Planctomycetota bacterium]